MTTIKFTWHMPYDDGEVATVVELEPDESIVVDVYGPDGDSIDVPMQLWAQLAEACIDAIELERARGEAAEEDQDAM